jgi:hypothetical protein
VQRVRPGATVTPRPIGAEAAGGGTGPRGAAENSPPARPRAATPPTGSAAAAERRS